MHVYLSRPWLALIRLSLLAQSSFAANLPDLIINSNAVNPVVVVQSFSSTDCEVVEGCTTEGSHTLLQFTTETWNIGNADLLLGNPTNNSLFYFSPCHGHYHFDGFAVYNLLDARNNVVVTGRKTAFCLEDVLPWNANASPNRIYNCGYQGIQQGWADVYAAGLPCQWIDITGVPPGKYVLQMIVNPFNLLSESRTNNNVVYVPFTIPGQCVPPPNDNFPNAQVLSPNVPQSVLTHNYCASTEMGESRILNVPGGSSLWYSWTPAVSQFVYITTTGSDIDTLLALHTGNSIRTTTEWTANDDLASGVLQSGIAFFASKGATYKITVDGVNGAPGLVQLNFNPPLNDNFANCEPISGSSGAVLGYNIGASRESGEPAHDAILGTHSVWYCWTAPADVTEVFDTIGSDFDTVLAIYTGNAVNSLSFVAGDNDSGGNLTSRVSFNTTGGVTYHIAVDSFTSTNVAAAAGNILLHWKPASGN